MIPPTLAPVDLTGYPSAYRDYPSVQPFSQRSSLTYQQKLEAIAAWIPRVLVPWIATNYQGLDNSWIDQANTLAAAVNTALDTQRTEIETALTTQQQQVADNLAETLAEIVAGENAPLYDAQVHAALQVANSTALALLDARYAGAAFQASTETFITDTTALLDTGRLAADSLDAAYGATPLNSRIAREFGLFVDTFGAVGDGTTDDTAAIQSAFTALESVGGGTLHFRPNATYLMQGKVLIGSSLTVEGHGAIIKRKYTGTQSGVTFSNMQTAGAAGYGSGANSITFRNLTIVGDYAGGLVDITVSMIHADNVKFEGCKFQQGMSNGHYLDLGGCRFVTVTNCFFDGANPIAGREEIEAIQIDVATYIGASDKSFPAAVYDGLPTRNVYVANNVFRSRSFNSITYPCPNPIGSHGAALTTSAGYFQDIKFVENTIEGYVATGSSVAIGWLHFRGVRNLEIRGNHFLYTGASGLTTWPNVISVTTVTTVTAEADTASATPASTTLATPRRSVNVNIMGNKFEGFANAPDTAGFAYIATTEVYALRVTGNQFDGANAMAIKVSQNSLADAPIISQNQITYASANGAIQTNRCEGAVVSDNVVQNTGTGDKLIWDFQGNNVTIHGNVVKGGQRGILADNFTNGAIQSNVLANQTKYAVEIGASGNSGTTTDTLLNGNRAYSTTTGMIGFHNGNTATRTRAYGNHWNTPTATLDNGTGTITTAYA